MNIKNSFSKKIRLNNSLIIREVFDQGVFKSLGPIGAKFRKTELESSLFAISIKKTVGSSPFRNRIKRLLRESIRTERSNLLCSYEICFFIVSRPRTKIEYVDVLDKVKFFFKYLNEEACNQYKKNEKE